MSLGFDARGPVTGAIATLSLGLAGFSYPQPAHAQQIYGAEGGRYFEYNCGSNRILVGLRGSAGILIDNIQAICARVVGDGKFVDAAASGPIFGGNRPQDQHVECPAGYGIAWSSIAKNQSYPHIGGVRLACQELTNRSDGGIRYIELRGTGHFENYDSPMVWDPSIEMYGNSIACPGGYAVGIRGRAEQYLDALGFICSSASTVNNSATGHTLGKRKKPKLDLGRDSTDSITTSIPQATTGRTLGKRKRPAQTGGAGSESNPNSMTEQPALTDGQIGVSLNSDGGVPLPAAPSTEALPPEPPSPLINGTYSSRLTVTDSRCITQNLRGSWQRNIDLTPRPGILIPLQEFNSMFAGPVMLSARGLNLSQSASIPVNFGTGGSVPANFNGLFTTDASRFEIRFEAGNALCSVSGTIAGMRL